MAKYREIPCKYYIALGQCKKGRDAQHMTYCQHCDKYCPRAKVKCINKKKKYNYIKTCISDNFNMLFTDHGCNILYNRWENSGIGFKYT